MENYLIAEMMTLPDDIQADIGSAVFDDIHPETPKEKADREAMEPEIPVKMTVVELEDLVRSHTDHEFVVKKAEDLIEIQSDLTIYGLSVASAEIKVARMRDAVSLFDAFFTGLTGEQDYRVTDRLRAILATMKRALE